MKEFETDVGPVKAYAPDETEELFVPLRNRIFDMNEGGLDWNSERIFRKDAWITVIIRGGVAYSGRSGPPREPYTTVEEWEFGDRRDELQPLFDLLVEDGILEVIHMSPYDAAWLAHKFGSPKFTREEAAVTRPTGSAVRQWLYDIVPAMPHPERLLFDHTGRWGMYGSDGMFGLLGGEPEFMERFIAATGGIELIREKADRYWQALIDEEPQSEGRLVPHYYKLAGWDNPPRRREG